MELQQARCRRSPACRLIIASCFLFGCTLKNPALADQEAKQYDESLREQFLKETPRRWAEYVEKTKRLQGRFSSTLIQSDGSASRNSYILKKGTGDRLSVITTREIIPLQEKVKKTMFDVQGFNPKYAFVLRRDDDSRPWVLTSLTERDESVPSFLAKLERGVDFNVNRLVYIESERVTDMVVQAEFRVIGCRRIHASGDELVSVDFDYTHEDVRRNEVQSGTLVLDPSRYWCLRSYNVRVKILSGGQGTVKFTAVKWRDNDGFPIPIAAMLETDAIEDNVRYMVKREHNYDLSIPESPPPDSEFTLAAFGFPEPEGLGRRRGVPWYLWAGVLGVVCIGLSVLLRWRARR